MASANSGAAAPSGRSILHKATHFLDLEGRHCPAVKSECPHLAPKPKNEATRRCQPLALARLERGPRRDDAGADIPYGRSKSALTH
jgi:hypothetical protein